MNLKKINYDYFKGKTILASVAPSDHPDVSGVLKKSPLNVKAIVSARALKKDHPSRSMNYFDQFDPDNSPVIIPDFLSSRKCDTSSPPCPVNFARAYESLIDDHMLWLIAERAHFTFVSNHLRSAKLTTAIYSALQFLELEKPDCIFFGTTPHTAHSYILAKAAEVIGCEIFYLQKSIFPWRFYIFEGVHRSPCKCIPKPNLCLKMGNALAKTKEHRYFMLKKSNVSVAMPKTEKNRIKRNGGKVYSLSKDLKRSWRRPDRLFNKYRCYQEYCKIAKRTPFLPKKYIVFFLHYQPERTTLPEGYGFTQQVAALRLLECCLPPGVQIVVKEHPSTFSRFCSLKTRSPSFYREIVSDRVQLANPNADPYGLIDCSLCVCTITGTVAGEAIFRGRPAIIFGAGPLCQIQSKFLHTYESAATLKEFVADVCSNMEDMSSSDEFEKIYHQVVRDTIVCPESELDLYSVDRARAYSDARYEVYSALFLPSSGSTDIGK